MNVEYAIVFASTTTLGVILTRWIGNKKLRKVLFIFIAVIVCVIGKVYVVPQYEIWDSGKTMQKNNHDFALMAEAVPNEYWNFVKEMREKDLNGTFTTEWARREALILFGLAEQTERKYASDESIYNYYKVDYEMNKKLFDLSPRLMKMRADSPGDLIPDEAREPFDRIFTKEDDAKLENSFRMVIKSGLKNEGRSLNIERRNMAKETTSAIYTSLDQIYGKDEDIDDNQRQAKLLAMEEQFLALGKEKLGDLSRYMDESE